MASKARIARIQQEVFAYLSLASVISADTADTCVHSVSCVAHPLRVKIVLVWLDARFIFVILLVHL